ncbi:hypothetical protein [Cellulomonas sp. SG140]|uniref:hypothetical protein n=1 Tax=Cellulomonas sp. SG140 TaxID=2976536 RepID=UPI0021E6F727|nr:hypothetical protein [Cellulomonas sp. SG140]
MDPTTIDIGSIDNVWQAVVVIALIVAVLVLPNLLTWSNARQAKQAAQEARDVMHHESKPNSGGSMKDSLNRIEAAQAQHGRALADLSVRVTSLEDYVTSRDAG